MVLSHCANAGDADIAVKNKQSATNDLTTFVEKRIVIEYLLEPAIDGRVITLWLRLYRQSGKATTDKAPDRRDVAGTRSRHQVPNPQKRVAHSCYQ